MFVPPPLHLGYHISQMQEQSKEKGSVKETGGQGGGRRAGVDGWVLGLVSLRQAQPPPGEIPALSGANSEKLTEKVLPGNQTSGRHRNKPPGLVCAVISKSLRGPTSNPYQKREWKDPK